MTRVAEMKIRELRRRELRQLQKDNAKLGAEIGMVSRAVSRNPNLTTSSSSSSQPNSSPPKGCENLRARMRLHSLLFRR